MTNPEYLLPELLAPLVRNTIFSGNIHHIVQADSTNSVALRGAVLAGQHPDETPEGAVFLAEEQTAGRGRSTHTWHSERGTGIYCSFLLRPPMAPSDALWLSLIAGVAVQDAVRETTGLAADIRWPNDLLIDGRKFCGILTEMHAEPDRIHHAVIGIGMNVNQAKMPSDLADIGTSLRIETHRIHSRFELLIRLLRSFDRYYNQFLADGATPILRRFAEVSTYFKGKRVRITTAGESFTGTTAGLEPSGVLRVTRDDGRGVVPVLSGDIAEAS